MTELERLQGRNNLALRIIKEASAWNSTRDFTQEEARRYHVALIMSTAILQGDLDEYVVEALDTEPTV